ncbi:MAG TPA: type II toxin-antitoxin system PemK/MazF family toxin [Planctomycetales bacterium]|jgi:mRNA interferase MazF|nr:type II toxin-antitoxin system PemK/MazF family toxin [Planctomycetales bacterium]
MPRADRGSVWIVDLGMAAKVRPCLVLSVPTDPQDRTLVTLIPHTTSVQGTRFEVAAQAKFLHGGGVFDAQQIVTAPQVKLLRKLGDLPPSQLALVEEVVRRWLDL